MKPVCEVGAGLICNVLGLRYWNSNDKRTLQTPLAPASLRRDAILHVRRTGYFLFHDTSNTGPTTGDGFHPESSAGPSDARRMEGGVAGLR